VLTYPVTVEDGSHGGCGQTCGHRCGGCDRSPGGSAGPTGGAPSRSPYTTRGSRTQDRAGAARGGPGAGGGARWDRGPRQGPGPVGQWLLRAAQLQRAGQARQDDRDVYDRIVTTPRSASRRLDLGRRSWDPLPLVRLVHPRPKKTGSSSSGCGCPTGCSPRSRWRRWAASANASGGTPAMSPTPEPPAPLDPHRGRLPGLSGLVVRGGFPDGTGEGRVVVCDVSDDSAATPSLEMTGA